MKRNECSLCGGKLDRNNRCTLCGLDNTKNDDMYKHMINRNDCEDAPLTHVHEEPRKKAPLKGGSIYTPDAKTYVPGNYQGAKKNVAPKRSVKETKKKTGKAKLIPLILLIFSLIGSVASLFETIFDDIDSYREPDYQYETEIDPYSEVVEEMPMDGEYFETVLEPGVYVVGGHIPQGIYEIDMVEGDSGYLNISDKDNWIYYTVELEYWGNSYEDDIRLYDGAIITISNSMKLEMITENAQPLTMEAMGNTLTDSIVLEEYMTVGEDIPAGVYDVYYTAESEEWGYVDCQIYYEDEYGDELENFISLYFSSDYGDEVYHNLVLTEKAEIHVVDLENVILVPAEQVLSEDLNEFYQNYL